MPAKRERARDPRSPIRETRALSLSLSLPLLAPSSASSRLTDRVRMRDADPVSRWEIRLAD